MTIANLTHQFLIASPQMPDERFAKTLIYICRHDKHGALGLIVNRPIINTNVGKLLEDLQLNVTNDKLFNQFPLDGGPVFREVGFVLHTGQPTWASSFGVSENVSITTSKDILENIAVNESVEHFYLCLGHASWFENQLEKEIKQGDWLLCPADLELLFKTPLEDRWYVAAEKIGINLNFLSDDIGHA